MLSLLALVFFVDNALAACFKTEGTWTTTHSTHTTHTTPLTHDIAGNLAADAMKPTFTVGSSVSIQFSADTFFCPSTKRPKNIEKHRKTFEVFDRFALKM